MLLRPGSMIAVVPVYLSVPKNLIQVPQNTATGEK
jgi:hypothetical protein